MKNIGKVLRIARIANDMTRLQASNISGVSQIYISELEQQRKTNVSDEILKKLAEAYNLTKSQMVALEGIYTSLDLPEERKFRRVLLDAVLCIEINANNKNFS